MSIMEDAINARPPPPIEATPGDLLMLLRAAVTYLEQLRNSDPDNSIRIDATAWTTKVSLDTWIAMREAAGKGEGQWEQ